MNRTLYRIFFMLGWIGSLMLLPTILVAQAPISTRKCEQLAEALLQDLGQNDHDTVAGFARLDSAIVARVGQGDACCGYLLANEAVKVYQATGDLLLTKEALVRAYQLAETCGSDSSLAEIHSSLAANYANLDLPDSAVWHANQFLKFYEKSEGFFFPGFLGYRMGQVYMRIGDLATAERWLAEALQEVEAHQQPDPEMYKYLLRDFAVLHEMKGDHPQAIAYFETLLAQFEANDSSYLKMASVNDLAKNRILKGDVAQAVRDFEYLWGVVDRKAYEGLKPVAAVNLGWSYEQLGDTLAAEKWYLRGLEGQMFPEDRLATLQHVSELQAGRQGFADAYQSLWQASQLWDTLEQQAPQARIDELVSQLDSTFYRLEEARTREQNALLKQERNYLLFSLAIAFLVVAVLVLLTLLYRRRQMDQRRELEKQREENRQHTLSLMRRMEVESLDAMLQGQDQERGRIAADLHDSLGGTLAAVKISLTMLQPQIEEKALPPFLKAVDLLEKGIQDVRRISHNLGDNVLQQSGLHLALTQMADTLRQANDFELDMELAGFKRQRFSNVVEVNLYRIVQELMQNVIKHARANRVSLQLSRVQNRLSLIVQDDGRGMDPEKIKSKEGMGMRNLQARVEKLEGTLHIDTQPGEGTTVTIQVPISDPNH